MGRCPWAIRYGPTLHTRCHRDAGHAELSHEGKGLAQFPYQRVEWWPGDRREYRTDRPDPYSWATAVHVTADPDPGAVVTPDQ